jgi:uncharacterized ion transporter superfamily protein YfcC
MKKLLFILMAMLLSITFIMSYTTSVAEPIDNSIIVKAKDKDNNFLWDYHANKN